MKRRLKTKKACLVCKKLYYPYAQKSKYCSFKCYGKMKKIRGDRVKFTPEIRKKISEAMKGSNNHRYGKPSFFKGKKRPEITGSNHPNWKNGYWIDNYGYKVIQSVPETNGKKVRKHRLVMEKHLGRKLDSSELIHHINGDKLDNRIENLEIVTRSKHIDMHRYELLKSRQDVDKNIQLYYKQKKGL